MELATNTMTAESTMGSQRAERGVTRRLLGREVESLGGYSYEMQSSRGLKNGHGSHGFLRIMLQCPEYCPCESVGDSAPATSVASKTP